MSIRLNVVLSQAAGGPPHHRELESELVARLIGAAGIDLSLIGPLESLAENSTDRLLLERLSGDLALLSWESPAAAAERLAASQIPGRRAPHPLDVEAAPAGGEAGQRRIFHHPLGEHSAAALQAALERLLASRRVVTFQLAPTAAATPTAAAAPTAAATPTAAAAPTAAATPTAAAAPTSRPAPASPATALRRSASARAEPRSVPDRWDALVDELNDSDL